MILPISRILQAAPGQCHAHGMQAPRIAPPNTRQGWNCSPPRNSGAAGIVGITHRTFMMIGQKKRRINAFQQLKQLLTQLIRCMMWPKRLHQHDDGGCFVQLCLSDFHWVYSSSVLRVNDMHMFRIAQIRVAGQILLNRVPGHGVTTVIFRMIRMAFHFIEDHDVALLIDGQKQKPP